MAKKKEAEEKVIEYSPAIRAIDRHWVVIVGTAFLITWILLVAAGLYVYEQIKQSKTNPLSQSEIKTVMNRLDTIEHSQTELANHLASQLTHIEQRVSETVNVESASIDLSKIEQELVAEITNQQEKITLQIDRELSGIRNQMKNLEHKTEEHIPQFDLTLSPLMMALVNLRERIQKSLPYAPDLAMVKTLSVRYEEMQEGIGTLENILNEGVDTIESLKTDYDRLAIDIIRASRRASGENGILDQTLDALSEVAIIRKVGELEGTSVDAIVARAEVRLVRGDLRSAIKELEQLTGLAAQTAAPWIVRGKRILEVEEIFASLILHITKRSANIHKNIEKQQKQSSQKADIITKEPPLPKIPDVSPKKEQPADNPTSVAPNETI